MKEATNELEIIEKTGKMLSLVGDIEVVYITAEFAPFSNQKRPDLIFIPKNQKTVFFIEYKKALPYSFSKYFIEELCEHKTFTEDVLQQNITYVFSTDVKIDPILEPYLKKRSIILFDLIKNEDDLYNAIVNLI
jgi:hypothetical protein